MIFHQQLIIETAVPPQEAWQHLLPLIDGRQFEGSVTAQDFNITRVVNRNSCIPVIRGRFEPKTTGTKIVIEMNMHPLGWVFLVGGVTISFFVLSALAADSQGFSWTGILAFAVPCVIGLLSWIAFTAEANTARAALTQLWPISRGPTGPCDAS